MTYETVSYKGVEIEWDDHNTDKICIAKLPKQVRKAIQKAIDTEYSKSTNGGASLLVEENDS